MLVRNPLAMTIRHFLPTGTGSPLSDGPVRFNRCFCCRPKAAKSGRLPLRITISIDGLAWSDDGAYLLLGGEKLRMVAAFGNDRTFMVIPGLPETVLNPAVRGARLVYARGSWSANIWRLSLDKPGHVSSVPAPLITSTREQAAPSFSPDGKQIAFQSNRSGFWEIWKCRSDGSNAIQLTFLKAPLTGTPRWSPDGQWIAFDTQSNGNGQIFVTSADGGVARMLTPEVSNEVVPNWSRDGKFVYFSSDRTGAMNLWKVPAAGGTEQQITRNGGIYPVESFDGSRIYYSKSGTTRRCGRCRPMAEWRSRSGAHRCRTILRTGRWPGQASTLSIPGLTSSYMNSQPARRGSCITTPISLPTGRWRFLRTESSCYGRKSITRNPTLCWWTTSILRPKRRFSPTHATHRAPSDRLGLATEVFQHSMTLRASPARDVSL